MRIVTLVILVFVLSSATCGQVRADSTTPGATADTQRIAGKTGWLTVHSTPDSAEVYENGVLLGRTPVGRLPVAAGKHVVTLFYPSVRLWNSVSGSDTLEVLPNRESVRSIDLAVYERYGILKRVPIETEKNPDLFLLNPNREDSRIWKSYAAGATMVLSGALSAYLKTHSDNAFDNYIATGDPQYLSSTRRLDKWAGVTLFISEMSFGYLTYLLLSE